MSEEHKARTREMIAVMQAYVDGQEIEFEHDGNWVVWPPGWDWITNNYRIATTPDSIDWSHVAPEWKWMARNQNGTVFLFSGPVKPIPSGVWWRYSEPFVSVLNVFASYKRGTVDWKDSLVERPA